MSKISEEVYNDGYYHFGQDIEKYPDAWCYVVWSSRGKGKTYSGLRYAYNKNFPIIYMKRTVEDVNFICDYDSDTDFDPSPFVPLNRDFGINVRPQRIKNGVGAFYNADEENEVYGAPVNYVLALSKVKAIKGIDLTNCEWILFDEFIPQTGEIVRHVEGDMLLDLYMTVSRDREKRGRPHLKLVLFANAEQISTPITNSLEIVDIMSEMNHTGENYHYERGIMLHHITSEEYPIQEEEKSGIYEAMKNTAWGMKAFEGYFANNDFSNVVPMSLKGMRCMYHLHYRKTNDAYIYLGNNGMYYMTDSPNKAIFEFDLDKENDQKKFYLERCIDLKNFCVNGKMKFKKYSMYDLIINFKKFYDV